MRNTRFLKAKPGGQLWGAGFNVPYGPGQAVLKKFDTTPASGAPVLVEYPLNRTIRQGKSVTLQAKADGTAPLQYRWFFNGALVAVTTEPKLTLPSPQFRDGGSYWLEVSNSTGTVASSVAELTVLSPPRIVQQPEVGLFQRRGRVVLEVRAEGSLPFAYQWYHEGQPLGSKTNATFGTLLSSPADAGCYHVSVRNAYGETRSEETYVRFTRLDTKQYSLAFTTPAGSSPLTNGSLAPGPGGAVWAAGSNGILLLGANGEPLWQSQEVAADHVAADAGGNAWVIGGTGLKKIAPDGRVLASQPGVSGTSRTVARDGSVLVAGTTSTDPKSDYRVQIFDPAAAPIGEILFSDGANRSGFPDGPGSIAVGPQREIAVGGLREHAVIVLSTNGAVRWRGYLEAYDFEQAQ
jgi:hypothetical protein